MNTWLQYMYKLRLDKVIQIYGKNYYGIRFLTSSGGGGGGGGGAAVGRLVVPVPAAIGCRASGPSVPEELSSDSGPK